MKRPEIVAAVAELRGLVASWRSSQARVGLIPTMGALHEGHLALVRRARTLSQKVIVSIFVNPTQFAPHEDFDRYPRTLDDDLQRLGTLADVVFAPSVKEMYPEGFSLKIEMSGPAEGLETDFRPHFLAGVATVVTKLLIAAMPDFAMFGEKDYQQLLVVRRLVRDLALPVEIVGAPIVRESDGLAMSSRNAYLDARERAIAGNLNRVIREVAACLRTGEAIAEAERHATQALLDAGFNSVDYVAVRDADTLVPLQKFRAPARVLAAARLGNTRLIDNVPV
jgi:pantoate--beta-alanine ligase